MEYAKVILSIILAYTANFLAPVTPFLVIVIMLVGADLYTGIRAAKKLGEYEPGKASAGLRNTVNKISQYFIAILLSQGMVLAFEIPTNYLPLTYIVALYIAMVEFKSNLENVAKVTGTDIWDVVRSRLNKLFNLKAGSLGEAKEDSSLDQDKAKLKELEAEYKTLNIKHSDTKELKAEIVELRLKIKVSEEKIKEV